MFPVHIMRGTDSPRRRVIETTAIAGMMALFATVLVWRQTAEMVSDTARARFELRTVHLAQDLVARAHDYETVLRGTRALFITWPAVDSQVWGRYVGALDLQSLYPGFDSLSIVRFVRASQLTDFLAARRREADGAGFAFNGPAAPAYGLLTYVAPDAIARRSPLGRDLLSDPGHRLAITQAGDSGVAAVTAPLHLLADLPGMPPTLVVYMPLYQAGQPEATVEDRRRALWGFIAAAIRPERMVAGVIRGTQGTADADVTRGVGLAITDVTDPSQPTTVYDNGPHETPLRTAFQKRVEVEVLGRRWAVQAVSLPGYPMRDPYDRAGMVARIAGMLGGVFTGLVYSLARLSQSQRELRLANAALARREADLERLAKSDPLTGLANRRHLMDQGSAEWTRARRHGRPLSLLLVDVDHFKAINDTHGHAAGDQVLCWLAGRLQVALREADVLARIGGEEFAVLLPETTVEAAQRVAERIRVAVAGSSPPVGDGRPLAMSVSIGVAGLEPGDHALAEMMGRADTALYAAKAQGRNRVVVMDSGGQAEAAATEDLFADPPG